MSNETFFQFFNSKQITALVTVGGLIIALFNLLVAARIYPLANSIQSLEARADHTDATVLNFIPRAELQATFTPIQEDIKEIKQDVRDIKNLLTN